MSEEPDLSPPKTPEQIRHDGDPVALHNGRRVKPAKPPTPMTEEQFQAILSRLYSSNPYGLWGKQALFDIYSLLDEVRFHRNQLEQAGTEQEDNRQTKKQATVQI